MSFMIGNLLILMAGVFLGFFSLGLKKTANWAWEHTWGLGSLFALLIFPWPMVFLTIPNIMDVYHSVPTNAIVAVTLFGLAWGVGGVTLGLAVDAVGMALGMSLVMSICTIFGSIGPALILRPTVFLTPSGKALIAGLIVMLLGISVCAVAGRLREQDLAPQETTIPLTSQSKHKPFFWGLILCGVSGVFSSLLNFALIFGEPIKATAVAAGATSTSAPNAIWAIVFTANYGVNLIYCVYLMIRNKNARQFIEKGEVKYWGWSLFLGFFWALSIVLYGIGADKLGEFGAYAGYPMFLIYTLLVSNLVGALTGEWKGARRVPKLIMRVGVSVLVLATVLFGCSNKLMAS